MLLGAAGGDEGVKADIWASHAPSNDGAKDTVRCRPPMHRACQGRKGEGWSVSVQSKYQSDKRQDLHRRPFLTRDQMPNA